MNKIKLANKMGLSQLIIKSLKGQQVSENEVYAINANKVPGLLHLDVVQKGSSFKLIYNITGFISLKEFLKMPLNKQLFAQILQNILANLKAVESAYFNQQYLLMDINQVYVNPNTQHIYFTYVPILMFESGTSLREFLLGIIQHGTFAPGEDNSYVRDYITILNSGINFSVFELEEYINKLLGQNTSRIQEVECPNCKTKLKKGTNYCHACGAKVSGNTGNTGKGVYDPLADTSGDAVVDDVVEEEVIVRKDNTQGLSDGTTVLGADPGGTTVLGSEELEAPVFPYLIREKTEEKISVNKPSFRIGAERKYVDYWVNDNSTVSRSHADILTREKRYFIIDLNSTNKTYVDGRAIPVEKEIELFDGTRIRLSNEEFVFHIES
ncbi:MAG: FHA domain-containing protein [Bacteroidales bacterium]|nr:FHA domain-containing protein [Bacteroidales bacterium]